MSVRFLIRFDDMCPTLNWEVWDKVEQVMIDEGVKPILSVIPDNQDPELLEAEPNELFWDRVRAWQARGWTIGLHGYQHRYVTNEAGIVGLNSYSEFAGLPYDEQLAKLQKGLAVFGREGVRADVWVAPAHSFDGNTLRALMSLGVRSVSDGMALYPHRDSQGVLWVPQQLWRFRPAPFGVWTICMHHKDDMYVRPEFFRQCIREYRQSISSFEEVAKTYGQRSYGLADAAFSTLWKLAIQVKSALIPPPREGNHEAPAIERNSESSPRLKAAQ
jgi:predicted deacetylase